MPPTRSNSNEDPGRHRFSQADIRRLREHGISPSSMVLVSARHHPYLPSSSNYPSGVPRYRSRGLHRGLPLSDIDRVVPRPESAFDTDGQDISDRGLDFATRNEMGMQGAEEDEMDVDEDDINPGYVIQSNEDDGGLIHEGVADHNEEDDGMDDAELEEVHDEEFSDYDGGGLPLGDALPQPPPGNAGFGYVVDAMEAQQLPAERGESELPATDARRAFMNASAARRLSTPAYEPGATSPATSLRRFISPEPTTPHVPTSAVYPPSVYHTAPVHQQAATSAVPAARQSRPTLPIPAGILRPYNTPDRVSQEAGTSSPNTLNHESPPQASLPSLTNTPFQNHSTNGPVYSPTSSSPVFNSGLGYMYNPTPPRAPAASPQSSLESEESSWDSEPQSESSHGDHDSAASASTPKSPSNGGCGNDENNDRPSTPSIDSSEDSDDFDPPWSPESNVLYVDHNDEIQIEYVYEMIEYMNARLSEATHDVAQLQLGQHSGTGPTAGRSSSTIHPSTASRSPAANDGVHTSAVDPGDAGDVAGDVAADAPPVRSDLYECYNLSNTPTPYPPINISSSPPRSRSRNRISPEGFPELFYLAGRSPPRRPDRRNRYITSPPRVRSSSYGPDTPEISDSGSPGSDRRRENTPCPIGRPSEARPSRRHRPAAAVPTSPSPPSRSSSLGSETASPKSFYNHGPAGRPQSFRLGSPIPMPLPVSRRLSLHRSSPARTNRSGPAIPPIFAADNPFVSRSSPSWSGPQSPPPMYRQSLRSPAPASDAVTDTVLPSIEVYEDEREEGEGDEDTVMQSIEVYEDDMGEGEVDEENSQLEEREELEEGDVDEEDSQPPVDREERREVDRRNVQPRVGGLLRASKRQRRFYGSWGVVI